MKINWSGLVTWKGTIDRGPYFLLGVLLCALKYNMDRAFFWLWSGERWSLLDYTRFGKYLWPGIPSVERANEFGTLLILSIPFMMVGVGLTLRRLRSAQLSPWLLLLFFVPVLKIVFFVLLSVIPSQERRVALREAGPRAWIGMAIPRGPVGAGAAGIAFAIANGVVCVGLGVTVLRQYGWSLFVGVPFALGFLSVLVFAYHERRTRRQCLGVAALALAFSGLALLAVAIEGALCMLMALPLALPLGLAGGFVAYTIQSSDWWHGTGSRTFCAAFVAPLLMVAEHLDPPSAPIFPVTTSVHVQASPEAVWRNVIAFPVLPAPHEAIFRAGIAYPIRARIEGKGAGALRYCEFSTGAFIEPIEVWDEPLLLRFSVTENPAPMQEWTPYNDLRPAHLDGFLTSHAGQFHLVRLPDGTTRLEGTTWYQHHLFPATYWKWWSDYIIHTIHLRVLRHVKHLSEGDTMPGGRGAMRP